MKRYYDLTSEECARLRYLAPLFDIHVKGSSETGLDVFNSVTMSEPQHIASYRDGHYRLLSEICSATIRWIAYDPLDNEHPAETLLRRTNAQLMRIAELARMHRHSMEQWERDSGL